jgi:hypothetical protein
MKGKIILKTGKNLFSLQGTPVLIAGSLFSLQRFPCKPLYFPGRDCSAAGNFSIMTVSTSTLMDFTLKVYGKNNVSRVPLNNTLEAFNHRFSKKTFCRN